MTQTQGTVYLVDDDPNMRKALMRFLKTNGLRAQAFGSAREFLDRKSSDTPACLVLDIRMPGMSGLDLQTELAKQNKQLPIVFITGHGDVRMSVQAMKGGAIDFLLKPFADDDLLAVIHQALKKDKRHSEARAEQEQIQDRLRTLTPRERQVFEFVIQGLLNKQIAGKLGASEPTIKVHRHRLMEKMGVTSVAELVQAAIKIDALRPSGELNAEKE